LCLNTQRTIGYLARGDSVLSNPKKGTYAEEDLLWNPGARGRHSADIAGNGEQKFRA
jgi:hypothetical protein